MHESPQNPYRSYLVSASAGSGKTYQLSRRFLSLVAAGADPGSILTVTFTIKAATEMRTRILEEAGRLCTDEALARDFSEQVQAFYKESQRYDEYQGKRHPPPLSARETGEKILAAAQSLKITTIDAIFLEWVARFPYEAGADPTGNQTIPAPFNLANRLEEELFRNMAWKALCRHLANIITPPEGSEEASSGIMSRDEILAELELERLAGLKKLVHELHAMDTYLWHEEMETGSALIGLEEPEGGAETPDELLDAISSAARNLTAMISNKGKQAAILDALARRSLSGLQEAGLLTKQLRLNNQTVSKKVRESCPLDAELIDEELRLFSDKQKIRNLNRRGALSYRFFQLYRFFYNQLRFARGSAEFADLVKGSYALFHSAGSQGVKFILTRTIHHLMLDEFQDTSVLQWSVFREVADHLMAGDSLDLPPGPMPSLFVVGDEKQSIYGFREADPEVMEFVRDTYRERLQVAPLNDSYRTAGIVLSFVNQIFQDLIPEFPSHQTARLGGKPVVPDHGVVAVLKTLPGKQKPKQNSEAEGEENPGQPAATPAEEEARAIASLLKQVLSEPWRYPVYDKKRERWRPIRPDDCAILYRSGTHAGAYDTALRALDIPCQRDEEKGFFQRPEIADVLALLTYLSSPSDLVALLTVCKSPIGAVPDGITFEALEACRSYPVRTGEFLAQLKQKRPELVAALSELAHAAAKIPPYELLIRAYQRLGILHAYGRTHGQSANEAHLATINLIALIERSLQAEAQGITGLFELCRYFARMSVIDEVGNAATASGAVTLMTIHKSKGLEYPLVILADSGRAFAKSEQYWTQVRLQDEDAGRRADKVTFSGTSSERPETSALASWMEHAGERTAQEAHRLLYVALTRAQHYVFVTGHAPSQQGGLAGTTYHSVLQQSCSELAESGQYAATEETIGDFTFDVVRSMVGTAEISPEAYELPSNERGSADEAQWAPAPFSADTVALKNELAITSPSKHDIEDSDLAGAPAYDWQDLLSKEALPPEMAAAVGTVVHLGIEALVKGLPFTLKDAMAAADITDKKSKKACTALYEKAAQSSTFKQLIGQGRLRTEVPLAYLDEDGDSLTLVRGSADLVIERDDEVIVVDYKSTRFALPTIGADLFSRSLLEEFIRSRGYDRQLMLYARALGKIRKGDAASKPVRPVIWFIDTDHLYWL